MRITTNQVMRNYQTALQSNLGGLTSKRNAILSGKKITHASQDPSTAFVASGLERRLIRTQSYIDTIKEVQARQDEQENAIMQLEKACVNIGKEYSVSALNDPSGEGGRLTYAKQLEGLQKEMISSMNAQYGDEFVFGGKSGMRVPFTTNAEGKLCYRGIQVTPSVKELKKIPTNIPKESQEYQDLVAENEKIKAEIRVMLPHAKSVSDHKSCQRGRGMAPALPGSPWNLTHSSTPPFCTPETEKNTLCVV